MSSASSAIENLYRERVDAMTPSERVARSAAMFQWTREQLARQIVAERGDCDAETLKWEVALRLYGDQPTMRVLIQRKLGNVSG